MEQINNVTQIFSLLFPTPVLEYDTILALSSFFSFLPLESFPKGNIHLEFYVISNSHMLFLIPTKSETHAVTSINIGDYISKIRQ